MSLCCVVCLDAQLLLFLLVAEFFRDNGHGGKGTDVLLFVDNIFRFTQAGSEVSALLGRIPSAVGYQPTLATDMGQMQERITTTKKGSITSVQVRYLCFGILSRFVFSILNRTFH